MNTIVSFQQTWPYVGNVLLFLAVTPPTMVLTAIALQLVGQLPLSYIDFLLAEAKQTYLITALIALPLSVTHTYLLRNAKVDSRPPSRWRSMWYLTLLGFLATLSLLRFLPLGYEAVFYIVPGTLCYGAGVGWLSVGALPATPSDYTQPHLKPTVSRYVLNAAIFVILATGVITVGVWTGLKTGLMKGLWTATPFFIFLLTVYLSGLHTFLLGDLSLALSKAMQQRSVGLAGGLASLATIVYILLGNLEFILLLATALIYGWVVSRLTGKTAG